MKTNIKIRIVKRCWALGLPDMNAMKTLRLESEVKKLCEAEIAAWKKTFSKSAVIECSCQLERGETCLKLSSDHYPDFVEITVISYDRDGEDNAPETAADCLDSIAKKLRCARVRHKKISHAELGAEFRSFMKEHFTSVSDEELGKELADAL